MFEVSYFVIGTGYLILKSIRSMISVDELREIIDFIDLHINILNSKGMRNGSSCQRLSRLSYQVETLNSVSNFHLPVPSSVSNFHLPVPF